MSIKWLVAAGLIVGAALLRAGAPVFPVILGICLAFGLAAFRARRAH